MRGSDELFMLIASLNRSEKRYFKLASSIQGGDKSYLKLFDAIERLTRKKRRCYDEALLIRELSAEQLITYLPVAKNYLYNLILKTMRTYRAEQNEDKKFRGMIDDLKFLRSKGLLGQCKKKLKKVKASARSHERHGDLIELAELEIDLMRDEQDVTALEKHTDSIYEVVFSELEKLENTHRFNRLNRHFARLNAKHMRIRSAEDRNAYRKIMDDPVMQDEKNALTTESRLVFNILNGAYNDLTDNVQEAYRYNRNLVEMIRENPVIVPKYPRRSISILRNHILASNYFGKHEEVKSSIDRLKNLKCGSDLINDRAALLGYMLEMFSHAYNGEFEQGYRKITEVVDKMNASDMPHKEAEMLNYFTFAQLCFGTERLGEASKWLYMIIMDEPFNKVREDIGTFARIVNLIVQFERGNQELVESNIKSLYRFLLKKKRVFKFETLTLRFIRKLNKSPGSRHLSDLFVEMKVELEQLRNDPYEKEAFEYFDFLAWIDSRLQNRPFAEVFMERAK